MRQFFNTHSQLNIPRWRSSTLPLAKEQNPSWDKNTANRIICFNSAAQTWFFPTCFEIYFKLADQSTAFFHFLVISFFRFIEPSKEWTCKIPEPSPSAR